MKIQRLLRFAGLLFAVLLVQRPALGAVNCDVLTDECSAGTLFTIADKAADVQVKVDSFKSVLLDLEDPNLRVIFSLVNGLEAKAGEIQTIADVTIRRLDGGVSDQDIEAIMFLVMMQAAKDMVNDLQAIMNAQRFFNQEKQAWRKLNDLIDKLSHSLADLTTSVTDLVSLIHCPACE